VFSRLLVANRGEIAVRVIRACRELGIETVAVYSEADRHGLHVRIADRAVCIGPAAAGESYLAIPRVIAAAAETGAQAVHPGYGFLSENAAFAEACVDAGLVFVGPPAAVIARMGSKIEARRLVAAHGVPVVPGEAPIDQSDESLVRAVEQVGCPVLVKPSAGGGGIGMRMVRNAGEALGSISGARREAAAAFGDPTLYVERLVERPRHVEIQVLADDHGGIVHLFERECSLQRRHQKVIEESPSPALTAALRARMGEAAVAAARAAGYRNAGTIEFLLEGRGDTASFYFLEMNTRLQVERPITEMVTALDLVQWQIRIARGERLDLDPDRLLTPQGHAIECRIYAEDPDNHFLPSPGRILALRTPAGPGIRDDSGTMAGLDVPIFYDPMISKLVAWAEDRPRAIARTRRALGEYVVAGIKTTLPFFAWLVDQPEFAAGRFHTTFLDELLASRNGRPFVAPPPAIEDAAVIAAALQTMLSPGGPAAPLETGAQPPFEGGSRWKDRARLEAVEGLTAHAVRS